MIQWSAEVYARNRGFVSKIVRSTAYVTANVCKCWGNIPSLYCSAKRPHIDLTYVGYIHFRYLKCHWIFGLQLAFIIEVGICVYMYVSRVSCHDIHFKYLQIIYYICTHTHDPRLKIASKSNRMQQSYIGSILADQITMCMEALLQIGPEVSAGMQGCGDEHLVFPLSEDSQPQVIASGTSASVRNFAFCHACFNQMHPNASAQLVITWT